MIMQSSWELPDAYLVSTGIAGDTSGDGTAPIASVSSSRPIMRTASNADSGLCDEFGEDEQNIAIRFRFVSTFTDFTDEDYESGWEDETTSDDTDGTSGGSSTGGGTGDGTGGTTGGGGTPTPETPTDSDKNDDPEPVVCSGGKEDNGNGICVCPSGTTEFSGVCKTNCTGGKEFDSTGTCVCPSGTTEYNNECKTNCTGNFAFDSEGNCTKCISNYYGNDCTSYCTETWSNARCVCNDSDSYWNGNSCVTCGTNQQVNETQNGCECKTNWHGEGCTTYCDTSVASMSSGTCVCEDKTTYWNEQGCESCGANKVYENGSCVCNNQSYADGDSCIQCPSGSTPILGGCDCDGDGNWNGSSCITCNTNATFTDNACKCNDGYYETGTSCTECKKPRRTNADNTSCECPTGTIWTGEETNRCEPDDDGSGGVTNLCEAGWVWDSEVGVCVENICSGTADCPYGYVCDITDGQCIKDWECENPHSIDVTQEECSECANRTWSEADKCVNCDSRKGLILSSGKCVCPAGKVMRLDETTGEYRCQCPENTPEEADEETCECPSGYDNIDENGDGINECVIVCPEGSGLTGVRNAQGNCLCDVDSGYIEVATKLADGGYLCSCDETNDYYTGPEGCIKCVQTTKGWCYNRYTGLTQVNCDTIDETKWWCGYRKAVSEGHLVYNPTTKDYCQLYEVLTKTDTGFACGICDNYTLYKESRTSNNGICYCRVGQYLEEDMCISECATGIYYETVKQCISCGKAQIYDNAGNCYTGENVCDTITNGTYWWYTWIQNTQNTCSQNFPNYTTDETDPCSYVHGCTQHISTLPSCDMNTKITDSCACSTGGTVGQYCCSTSSYPTANGCVSCTDGTIPNASRTGCEECPANMIAKNGVCTRCDEGYYPNSTQIRCLACPAGTTTDAEGLACTVCVDTEKVFDNTTGTCLDPCTQTADCSESTDGMCCDSERKVCRKCIPDDCNTNKGFEYADGKCICSAQTPILQNGECVACSSEDENKPYWDGVECVATCPTEKAYVADNVCVESCPMDKPYVDNASCVSECPTERPYLDDGVCVGTCPSDNLLEQITSV
ncbi:MAG: hypothetical protein E7014_06455 [Alphaproteobacteria bacterium]|nr:hypothetical protein [Alphaproteobacteria bacterium]